MDLDDSIIGSDVKPFYHGVSALEVMLNNKIKRSISRIGNLTSNPITEAKDSWLKKYI